MHPPRWDDGVVNEAYPRRFRLAHASALLQGRPHQHLPLALGAPAFGQGLLQDAGAARRLSESPCHLQPRPQPAGADRGLRQGRFGRSLPQPQQAQRGRAVVRGARLPHSLDAGVPSRAARAAVAALSRARLTRPRRAVHEPGHARPADLVQPRVVRPGVG